VSIRGRPISRDEIHQAFIGPDAQRFPPILTPAQFAMLVQVSIKTVYDWIARDRLNGSFRKRGKHVLIWRDRALHLLFNGQEWK
jgi:hypothetical protein